MRRIGKRLNKQWNKILNGFYSDNKKKFKYQASSCISRLLNVPASSNYVGRKKLGERRK